MSPARSEFIAGAKAQLPMLAGVIPFGMIYGAFILGAGFSPFQAEAASWIIFAGSSQFIAARLVQAGAPILVILLTILIINLRHGLYSLSLAPYLQHLRSPWKWLLAYFITDETYAIVVNRYTQKGNPVYQHWFFLGSGLVLWVVWQASTVAGILLGAKIPASLPLDFVIPLTLIALVVPALKNRVNLVVALTAGILAVMLIAAPFKLGLLLATLGGIWAGLVVQRRLA
jgi:4-azaleucine resistance transporter AzlC